MLVKVACLPENNDEHELSLVSRFPHVDSGSESRVQLVQCHMYAQRMTAEMDEPFVVFLIGMRINSYWKIHKWLPVAAAMPRMLRELEASDDSGLLSFESTVNTRTFLMVQYWDSFESLRKYARDIEQEHVPAWIEYNQTSGQSGDVGIFHETYLVDPDDCENVYNNMPAFGLGGAGTLKPAEGSFETAAKRLGTEDDGPAVADDGTPIKGVVHEQKTSVESSGEERGSVMQRLRNLILPRAES
jgi:hypothetical protein